ncbi:Alpha/beta hydrolase family [Lotmaria passim]
MSKTTFSSGAAPTAPRDPVAVWSKVRFLCFQSVIAVCINVFWQVKDLITGRAWCVEKTHAFGSAQARSFFQLDKVDNVPYTDPAYSGHVNTILCAFRPHRHIPYERFGHPSEDGNPMFVDWYLAGDAANAKGLFIIIPGLASWSGTNYIEHFVWFAHEHNFHCCVFNTRGMGDTPIETPRLMSAKWTNDIRAVMHDGPLSRAAIEQRCGRAVPIVGVGFSLGGIILSNFVSEECKAGRATVLDAVIVVNSPLDCLDSNTRMCGTLESIVYQRNMIGALKAYARRHSKVLKDLPGLEASVRAAFARGQHDEILTQMKTVHDFDKVITAPTLGFATPEEYYHNVSPVALLPHFTLPVLCVSAVDDPVCGPPPMDTLTKIMATNTNVALLTTPRGGHLGYIRSIHDEWIGKECFMETLLFNVVAGMAVKR